MVYELDVSMSDLRLAVITALTRYMDARAPETVVSPERVADIVLSLGVQEQDDALAALVRAVEDGANEGRTARFVRRSFDFARARNALSHQEAAAALESVRSIEGERE